MGKRRPPRFSGLLPVAKTSGPTSHDVVDKARRALKERRIGHTGTLDPMATGIMICTINRATRLSRFFLESPKKYTAVLKLGVETDTLDATGSILTTRQIDTVSEHAVRKACKQFEGEIEQIPPAYSALKHHGLPLYFLAYITKVEIHGFSRCTIQLQILCGYLFTIRHDDCTLDTVL